MVKCHKGKVMPRVESETVEETRLANLYKETVIRDWRFNRIIGEPQVICIEPLGPDVFTLTRRPSCQINGEPFPAGWIVTLGQEFQPSGHKNVLYIGERLPHRDGEIARVEMQSADSGFKDIYLISDIVSAFMSEHEIFPLRGRNRTGLWGTPYLFTIPGYGFSLLVANAFQAYEVEVISRYIESHQRDR